VPPELGRRTHLKQLDACGNPPQTLPLELANRPNLNISIGKSRQQIVPAKLRHLVKV
jgi:hypothetical protein